MKSCFLRIIPMIILLLGTIPVGGAPAAPEDDVKFSGAVESLPIGTFIGDWTVAGRVIHVSSATVIHHEDGVITIGTTVKVEGTARANGSVDATVIEFRQAAPGDGDLTFKGTVQSFPGTPGFVGVWIIGGRTIHVMPATRIETTEGPVVFGAFAEVLGVMRADGSMDAVKIEIKSNLGGEDGRDELTGIIQSLPGTATLVGDWRVTGHTVHVTASTLINREHGSVSVGALVQ
ncbi:MAG TPA: DUF5666 domain-containing protein, partial [Blastocatellia bacterium]|nr:DUF5666 domain-containing protein [Blastocatellia bacterium]